MLLNRQQRSGERQSFCRSYKDSFDARHAELVSAIDFTVGVKIVLALIKYLYGKE